MIALMLLNKLNLLHKEQKNIIVNLTSILGIIHTLPYLNSLDKAESK